VIQGTVTADGVPTISLPVAGKDWTAIVDTGFNGDLELPAALRAFVNPRYLTSTEWLLAGGQRSVEETFEVDFPFDGAVVAAEATFVPDDSILVGTGLMAQYRLTVDFSAGSLLLEHPI
jgi:predicted aspartyl protease